MANGDTEQVDVKLPSGETVTAVVPSGATDDQVRSLMMSKHPEMFGRSIQTKPGGSLYNAQTNPPPTPMVAPAKPEGAATRYAKGVTGFAGAPATASEIPEFVRRNLTPIPYTPFSIPSEEAISGVAHGFGLPASLSEIPEWAKNLFRSKGSFAEAMSQAPIVAPIGRLAQQAETGDFAGTAGGLTSLAMLGTKPADIAAGIEKARVGISEAPATLKSGAQSAMGVGGRFLEDSVKARNIEAANAKATYEESVKSTSEANFDKILENESKWQNAQKTYQQAVQTRESAIRVQQSQVAKRQALDHVIQSDSAVLSDSTKGAERNVRTALNSRYNSIKSVIGNELVDAEAIAQTVKEAKSKFIKGSPENIKQFNELMPKEASLEDASVFQGGGISGRQAGGSVSAAASSRFMTPEGLQRIQSQLPPEVARQISGAPKELNFNDTHGFYSELGDKLFSGKILPGDVYQAIKHVWEEGLGKQLQITADKAQQGTQWASVQHDWGELQKDFHDMRSMAGGGSPVARIVRAVDPGYVAQPLTSKAAQRAVMILEKYSNYGTQPNLARQIIQNIGLRDSIPSTVSIPKEPAPPVRMTPKLKPPPEAATVPPVDTRALRLEKLEKKAQPVPFEFWKDLVVPGTAAAGHHYLGLPPALAMAIPIIRRIPSFAARSKFIRELLSTPSAKDAAILRKQI